MFNKETNSIWGGPIHECRPDKRNPTVVNVSIWINDIDNTECANLKPIHDKFPNFSCIKEIYLQNGLLIPLLIIMTSKIVKSNFSAESKSCAIDWNTYKKLKIT